MDIYGMDAKNKAGSYFQRNCIAWYPLADYIIDKCPKEITAKCQYWHSNDCDGLDEEDAIKLADFIDEQIEKYPNDGDIATKEITNEDPDRSKYRLVVDDLKEFSNFLRHCGGFEIG